MNRMRRKRFLLPEGAEIIGQAGDDITMSVSVPLDDDGFLGRECPSCTQTFRINGDDYEELPDDLHLWCVYCGHREEHTGFLTQQQQDRAMRTAGDIGVQMIGQAFDEAFGKMARRTRGRRSTVQVNYRSKPFYPRALPGIDEERLIRIRQCDPCAVRYAVFGEHRYCPVCGPLPPLQVALDALQAETARLDALDALPQETAAALREQGVFHRIWVDTLENLVGIVETYTEAVYREAVSDADLQLRGKGKAFQRLDEMAVLVVEAGYPDLAAAVGTEVWQRLAEVWAVRHVFTHSDGVVDEKYLRKVSMSTLAVGQRLTVSERNCRQAIADVTRLCAALR